MSADTTSADDESSETPSRMWLVLLTLCLVAAIGAGALILLTQDDEDIDPQLYALRLGWAVPDGEETAGSITLGVDPADGGTNQIFLEIDSVDGSWLSEIDRVEVEFIPYRGDAEANTFTLELQGNEQRGERGHDFSGSDSWEVRLSTADVRLATFFLLLPDPNVQGNETVPLLPDDPEAVDLFERASASVAAWHRVRYEQQLSDGAGLSVVSFRAVNDGSDGSTPGFRYVTPDGLEAYVIGSTAWTKYPDEAWDVRETNALIPPSEWGGEYAGATGFQMGPMSETREGPCRVITFVVPGNERQAIAWYAWCIEDESGTLYRDSMISRAHYMITEFSDFDGDVQILLPADANAVMQASPSPETTVSEAD